MRALLHEVFVLTIDLELLKAFSDDVKNASKQKAAAEWAARQAKAKIGKK
jgi:hypothetical protein